MNSENDKGFREIINLTRMIGIVILLLHFYYCCYDAFSAWHLSSPISDRILENLIKTGLFNPFWKAKGIALGALLLTVMASEGRKSEKLRYRTAFIYLLIGLILYFGSVAIFFIILPAETTAVCYMLTTTVGYLLIMSGGAILTRIVKLKLNNEVFNKANETFPQEERLLTNEYSVNLPTRYRLKNKERQGWINIINGFRGTLLSGLPGSGKTLIVKEIIKQQIKKQYTMLVYDFKYPDLTLLTYNYYLKYRNNYKVSPSFYTLNFDKPYHRSNPLMPGSLKDVSDAAEGARTILLGLNKEWISKQGDFWVESSINFITAVIWYLKKVQHGKYCTLPHVIELVQQPYDKLFSILRMETELEALIQPFVNAYLNGARQQLEGQIAGATISLAKLSSPNLYYVLSGNDFSLDIANPKEPKIVCIANNPQKAYMYGAVISLYLTALQRLANKPDNLKSSIILEEFATLFFNGIDRFLAVCRSYLVAITIVIQDASQLSLHYGKQQSEVILNLVGNILSGQVTGESAKKLSERFGRIRQDKENISIDRHDTSISRTKQLDYAVPQSTISALSSGEVVGMVADNPDQPIPQKMFHSKIQHDFNEIRKEESGFKPLPEAKADENTIRQNYLQIKSDIKKLVEDEMLRLLNTPGMEGLVI